MAAGGVVDGVVVGGGVGVGDGRRGGGVGVADVDIVRESVVKAGRRFSDSGLIRGSELGMGGD
jgi:hypothetical protein